MVLCLFHSCGGSYRNIGDLVTLEGKTTITGCVSWQGRSLEDTITYLRKIRPVMVATLDERMYRQRKLAEEIVRKKGFSPEQLCSMKLSDLPADDIELQLCYNVLRDTDYIDNLR